MKREKELILKRNIEIISFSRWSIGGGFNSVQSLGKSYVSTIIADVNITAVWAHCVLLVNLAIQHTLKIFLVFPLPTVKALSTSNRPSALSARAG